MREYLTSAPIRATRDLDEAREAVARVYIDHRLEGRGPGLDMRLNALEDQHLTLGYLTYGAATTVVLPASKDSYHVNLTLEGQTQASRTDGTREVTLGRVRGIVASPVQSNAIQWHPRTEQLILKISRSVLETHLADLTGSVVTAVIDFDYGVDLTDGAGRGLFRAVEFLASELDQPAGLAAAPLARAQLEAYVLTSLLQAGRHQFTDLLNGVGDRRRTGRLGPVLDHVESHLDEELTPVVLARVGCVSVRTLHASFQAELGESPMAYVRRLRLHKVREDLLQSDPRETHVTDVAMRWGFFHASRFASQYYALFDERPSGTLRRWGP